jgi:hypothetical protein
MNRYVVASLVPFAFLVASSAAHAEPPANAAPDPSNVAAAEPPPATTHVWYGWQTLLVDAASFSLMAAGAGNDNSPLLYAGVGGYALGGPAVHIANGESGRAALSLGVRIVLPAIGAAIGYASYRQPSKPDWFDFGPGFDAAIFGVVGGLAACVIDAAAIAHHRVAADPPPPPQSGVSVTPSVAVEPHGGARAGLVGTF